MNSRRIFAKLNGVSGDYYDYIIAGGGMAGLSLAFYLNESDLRAKKILVLDRAAKSVNDHTWCFWEREKSAFEEIIFHRWKKMWFHGAGGFSKLLDAAPYDYKMIRAADFYKYIFDKIRANPNIEFRRTEIKKIEADRIMTGDGEFTAQEFIFDSVSAKKYDNPRYRNLYQHFLGWTIETKEKVFNALEMTLFDFRVAQENECRFVYLLPFAPHRALIEYTIFSDNILPAKDYEAPLRKYLSEILRLDDYTITETERGVIPMSDEPHEEFSGAKIVRIGTAGGYVKPSTGYSFQRTQRRLQNLVEILGNPHAEIKNPKSKIRSWKDYLDSVLLDVLQAKSFPADEVFTRLFSANKTAQMLKFLDEDTSVREDFKIMQTVPLAPFAESAARVAWQKLK